MTGSITSLLSNTYSQLTGKSASTDKTSTSDQTSTTLADALSEAKGSDAFTLSLSDEALKQLQAARQKVSGATQQTDSFTLNSYQQDALDAIIEKYADKPLTDENYAALQNELYEAGISPQQLSLMDKVSSFNSTQALMDALNGKDYDPGSFLDSIGALDETKTDNFLNDIVSRWNDAYNAAHPEEPETETETATDTDATDSGDLESSGEASA